MNFTIESGRYLHRHALGENARIADVAGEAIDVPHDRIADASASFIVGVEVHLVAARVGPAVGPPLHEFCFLDRGKASLR